MSEEQKTGYQVLARKYRPETFADLVGQDAMVRTLKNAFAADRIAQAFILTGIRGTGKTTTARIIAKGLNCTGPDGQGGPTTEPCGQCEACRAISAGQHVDVIEMDGASQTRIDDIRSNVLESVHYAPTSARYKIYIIDEVHMLSTSAFNALLKTLEEPPPHVKFIFATTEIRKVPVTVLSRCQRFDLRRIEPEEMIALLRRIADAEGASITDEALALITRAAEGSARDATSLLDQAISHGAGETTAEQVRAMLGLADRGRVLDLFDMILKGDAAGALGELGAQYADGADPLVVLRDLAEIAHWVSVVKITPDAADDPTIAPEERARGQTMAESVPMRVLSRMWQMLLKALEEVAQAPSSMMAAEMAVIRLTHVADLPSPDELVKKLAAAPAPAPAPAAPPPRPSPPPAGGSDGARAAAPGEPGPARPTQHRVSETGGSGPTAMTATAPAQTPDSLAARYPTFEDVIALIRAMRDMKLLFDVESGVRLVSYAPGRIEFEPAPGAPVDLAQRLGRQLAAWTGARWGVSVVSGGGGATIADRMRKEEEALRARAASHPHVKAVLDIFPGAEIRKVRTRGELIASASAGTLPGAQSESDGETQESDDEAWDPFERD